MSAELPAPGALVVGATAAHRRLMTTLDAPSDEAARSPSLLPDWTVGHVVTHLARNADSHLRIVFHRWREVEIHHADLGLGYGPDDWPEEYVALELPRQLTVLPDRLDASRRHHLLAWLFGREPQPDLEPLATDTAMFRA